MTSVLFLGQYFYRNYRREHLQEIVPLHVGGYRILAPFFFAVGICFERHCTITEHSFFHSSPSTCSYNYKISGNEILLEHE